MAGQHTGEAEDLTRSKITNAYEHVDDSDIAGARKRVQMYARDPLGDPIQITADATGKLDTTASFSGGTIGLENVASARVNPATEEKQDTQIIELQKLIGFEIGKFDYIALTYVAAGNGAGEIETVVYKIGGAGGSTIATLTLAYNVSNEINSITKT